MREKAELKEEVKYSPTRASYYSDWSGIHIAYLGDRVRKMISELEACGIDKWKTVQYALEQLLDRDVEELTREITEWHLAYMREWKRQKAIEEAKEKEEVA